MYAVLNKIKIKSKILPYILKKNADINIKIAQVCITLSCYYFLMLIELNYEQITK